MKQVINRQFSIESRAILLAAECRILDEPDLTSFLYNYNRRPFSIKNNYSILLANKLLQDNLRHNDQFIANNWLENIAEGDFSTHWRSWQNQNTWQERVEDRHIYKLYIGITFEKIVSVLTDITQILSNANCFSFKLGRNVVDLLRADYFICYFWSFQSLIDASNQLRFVFSDFVAGVIEIPFTAMMSENPYVFWGVDLASDSTNRLSWRYKTCASIASILKTLNTEGHTRLSGLDLLHYVHDELMKLNVNSKKWCYNSLI